MNSSYHWQNEWKDSCPHTHTHTHTHPHAHTLSCRGLSAECVLFEPVIRLWRAEMIFEASLSQFRVCIHCLHEAAIEITSRLHLALNAVREKCRCVCYLPSTSFVWFKQTHGCMYVHVCVAVQDVNFCRVAWQRLCSWEMDASVICSGRIEPCVITVFLLGSHKHTQMHISSKFYNWVQ